MLSTFTVTDPTDTLTNGMPTVGTLRWAVGQADAATTPSTINFSLGSSPTTITLAQGDLELTNVPNPVAIDGPGSGLLAIDGDNASRIFKVDKGVSASISGCEFVHGSMSLGGAVYNGGDLTLRGCLFLNNTAPPVNYVTGNTGASGPGSGGAIFNSNASLSLFDCTLTGNTTNFGGAISNQSNNGVSAISLTDCTLSGNIANIYKSPFGNQGPAGGAIQSESIGANASTTITMTGCTISGNTAVDNNNGSGGGLDIYAGFGGVSDTSLTGCTISGNTSGHFGGGLDLSGSATLTDCTISGNTAQEGGGVQVYGAYSHAGASTLGLVACTISGNTSTGAPGGGLSVFTSSYTSYYGYTYTGPTPQVSLTDTIIAGNTGARGASDDIGGNFPFTVSGSYNLIGTGGSGGLSGSHNLIGVADPGLAPLGDYGGPTETMPLQPTSPAVGAGIAVPGATTDQRGFLRTGSTDIGAFQQAPGPLVVNTAIDGQGSLSGDLSLRQAVNLADVLDEGSTIAFDARAFAGPSTITLTSGQLELGNTADSIAIDGPGASLLAIDGNHASRVFQVDPGASATISGLTVKDGHAEAADFFDVGNDGGGLFNQGTLTLDAVTVSDNFARGFGGGIANSPAGRASITMTACSITGNRAGAAGGVANGFEDAATSPGTMTLTGCTISGNTDYSNVGGFLNSGTATLTGCSISGNTDQPGLTGGIYFNFGDTLTLTDCSIDDNFGGGITAKFSGDLTLTGCSVNRNSYSGGVTTIETRSLTITDSTISGNTGLFDGGVEAGGPSTIINSTISGNTATLNCGGLALYGAATVTDCTISGNSALNLDRLSAQNATGGGLQVESNAVATITGCTISGNTSDGGYGGGAAIDGMATLTDCTISGNSAAAGGGVFNYGAAALVACTVSGNSAPQGGGIDNYSSPSYTSRTTLTGTIVAGNTTGSGGAASDIGGTDPGDVTGSFNLIGTGGSGGLSSADNLLNVANPGLAPLGNYGGSTQTMPLLPGSPAIDAGSNALDVDADGNPLTIDQRGLPRVVNGTVDIGAFETSGFIITPVPRFQATIIGTAFPSPLTIRVTPIHPGDPVAGGVVTLAAPTSGASATLSASSIILNATGSGSVTAIANNIVGFYTVGASASGARVNNSVPGFELENGQAIVDSFKVGWGNDVSPQLFRAADGLRSLPAGRSNDLPWLGIRTLNLGFSLPFTLTAADITVTGITVADYGPVTVTGSGSSYTITLAQPINAADRVTLSIHDPALQAPFIRRLDVLPGDVGDFGMVNAQDIVLERDLYLDIPLPNLPAATFGDILGEGKVDANDYNAVRKYLNTTLPPLP